MNNAQTQLITPTARPAEARRDTPAAAVGALFAAVIGGWVTSTVCWSINPELTAKFFSPSWHFKAGLKSIADIAGFGFDGFASEYANAMTAAGWSAEWRVTAMWLSAAVVGGAAFALLNQKVDPIKHIRGRQLRIGKQALKESIAESALEIGKTEAGIELIRGSGLRISQDRETKHQIIVGGTGSGKTVAASHIITQAIERQDRLLIIDYKGLTEKTPGRVKIVDPTDSRGTLWDIAADVRTQYDAQETAMRMIPDGGNDPFWANGSRAILAGLMTCCINTKGKNWGFKDIAELMRLPIESYAEIMAAHYPQATAFVANAESNATDSLIKNMSVSASFIYQLAAAEIAAGDKPRISFREWIQNPDTENRTVILKINDAFSSLSASFNQAILGVICGRVSSLPDVPPNKNRVWIIADEFPRLGKVIGWDQFLAVGRSKSLRIVTVVQSVSQLKQTFGEHETDTWISIVGTLVLGRNDGATSKWYCDIIGQREVWTPSQNVAASAGGFTTSNSFGRETLPVILPSQCATDLGVREKGCLSIMYGFNNAHILEWKFLSESDNWTKRRSDYKAASWTLPENLTEETTPITTAQIIKDEDLELSKSTIVLTSVLDFTLMDHLDVDVYTLKADEQVDENKGDEVENEAANHSIEAIADHAFGDVAGHGIGIGLALIEELGGQSIGAVDQQIIAAPQKKKRFSSRNKEAER